MRPSPPLRISICAQFMYISRKPVTVNHVLFESSIRIRAATRFRAKDSIYHAKRTLPPGVSGGIQNSNVWLFVLSWFSTAPRGQSPMKDLRVLNVFPKSYDIDTWQLPPLCAATALISILLIVSNDEAPDTTTNGSIRKVLKTSGVPPLLGESHPCC